MAADLDRSYFEVLDAHLHWSTLVNRLDAPEHPQTQTRAIPFSMTSPVNPVAPETLPADAIPWHYELVPLFALPRVDLSVSIRSRLVRNAALTHTIRCVGRSSATFIGYMMYLATSFAVFFIPASIGRTLAIVGAVAGLPAALLSIGDLRFDMVRVLLQTYDIWFFSTVSTLMNAMLGLLFHDARSLLVLILWLSVLTNTFIDARVIELRRLWLANVVSATCLVAMGGAVSVRSIDDMRMFNVFQLNGHTLPASAVVRDAIVSTVLVLLRNIVRGYRPIFKSPPVTTETSTRVTECVSFRCRLCIQAVVVRDASPSQTSLSRAVAVDLGTGTRADTTTQLRFAPLFEFIDARDTLLPVPWLWSFTLDGRDAGSVRQLVFKFCGIVGFSVTNVALVSGVISPTTFWQRQPPFMWLTQLGIGCSLVFIGIGVAAMHRRLVRAITTSFDFLFVAAQAIVVHVALLDLCKWQPLMAAVLATELLWSCWMMCWDALLPPARQWLGLTTRFAAWVGTGLIVVMTLCNFMTVVVLPAHKTYDRIVCSGELLGVRVDLRPFPWYVSCSATIFTWSLRVIWRLWHAGEMELVVLDGPVVYDKPHRSKTQQPALHAIVPVDAG